MTLLMAAVLLLALLGSLLIHSVAARQALQVQLNLRNRDAAAALAAAMSAGSSDPAALRVLATRQFEMSRYQRIRLQTEPGAPPLFDLQQQAAAVRAPRWFMAALPLHTAPGRAPVASGSREIGMLEVEADESWAHEALWAAYQSTAALLAALGACAAVLVAWALRAWRRPLQAAIEQARALEQGRFVEQEEPPIAELRELTRSMNATVRRLREVSTAQAEQVALLQRQAQLDGVTGLPLRAHFLAQLERRLAEPGGPGVALLLVRVMQLEALNPRLGHEATDGLLGGIADVLETYVQRVPGTFAGRLNGSDFALCLPVAGVAAETAESLRATLAASPALRAGGAQLVVGGADGLHDVGGSAALAAADSALARAEAEVENAVGAPHAGMVIEQHASDAPGGGDAATAGARAWREQIAAALAQGRTELAQFVVVDRHGRELHLECPLRVQLQPGGEFQAAERWLAMARRSRLMPQVDLAALELALRAIAADGRRRAVHASAAALASPGFIAAVALRLTAAPDAARLLSIECVEGPRPGAEVFGNDLAAAVQAWRGHGVRIGVEHAGASPQRLPRLQGSGVDYVKVDTQHLRGAADDPAVNGYAQSLVALIHGLGLQALAAGIDDRRDLAALWALGFDGATGPAVAPGGDAPAAVPAPG